MAKKLEGAHASAKGRRVSRLRTSEVASLLRRRIQWGVHLGFAKPGDRLPSLRAAANEFGVDQRSVLAAYRELETEGVVVMRPRSGIYVAADGQAPVPLPSDARWMSELFLQGFARGVPPTALGRTLTTAATARTLTAACLECNADQILWMASQLRQEFGMATSWIETTSLDDAATIERLEASDLIVTTSFHAAEARQLGSRYGLPVVIVTAARDGVNQLRAELGRGPVYFVGTDERYMEKLIQASDCARWLSNLRPVTADRFVAAAVPPDARLAVSQAAAEVLGNRLPSSATVVDNAFSNEARSEIIAVMLSAYFTAAERVTRSA